MSVEPRSLETTEHVADCTCANCDPGRLGFKLPGSQSTDRQIPIVDDDRGVLIGAVK